MITNHVYRMFNNFWPYFLEKLLNRKMRVNMVVYLFFILIGSPFTGLGAHALPECPTVDKSTLQEIVSAVSEGVIKIGDYSWKITKIDPKDPKKTWYGALTQMNVTDGNTKLCLYKIGTWVCQKSWGCKQSSKSLGELHLQFHKNG